MDKKYTGYDSPIHTKMVKINSGGFFHITSINMHAITRKGFHLIAMRLNANGDIIWSKNYNLNS